MSTTIRNNADLTSEYMETDPGRIVSDDLEDTGNTPRPTSFYDKIRWYSFLAIIIIAIAIFVYVIVAVTRKSDTYTPPPPPIDKQ